MTCFQLHLTRFRSVFVNVSLFIIFSAVIIRPSASSHLQFVFVIPPLMSSCCVLLSHRKSSSVPEEKVPNQQSFLAVTLNHQLTAVTLHSFIVLQVCGLYILISFFLQLKDKFKMTFTDIILVLLFLYFHFIYIFSLNFCLL